MTVAAGETAPQRAAAAWFPGPVTLRPLGAGHINDTWRLTVPGRGQFVLQRLSAAVFPDPRQVADKVARVVGHLRRGRRVRVPALVASRDGSERYDDPEGGVWRVWELVGATRTLGFPVTPAEAESAGAAFGAMQRALADFPDAVADPIPGFMRLEHYLGELDAVVAGREPGRASNAAVNGALERVQARRDLAGCFAGRDRLIHGDCKIDNLLYHLGRPEVACIIDLDTVMCGHWAWDFGDLARSAAAEDGRVSVELFRAVARGFTGSGAIAAAPAETAEALVLAPRYVALMLGVRFLTDHLRGDRYFKVAARGENLGRALRQLELVENLERREAALRAAVARL